MGCGASAGKADEPAAAAPAPSQGKKERKKEKKNNENLVSDMVKDMGSNVKEGGFGRQFFINSQSGRLDDNYKVDKKELGRGTYGSVSKGKNKVTGVTRAIKAINKKSLPDPRRFADEIEVMRALDHPNIVKLYETYEDARNVYLVMELCTGGELFDRIIEANYFSERVAAYLIRQILSAVFYMHTQNIAHRDLKPENFLLGNEKSVEEAPLKIIDFGLSKRFQAGVPMTTKACTPYYVAPEVLDGSYNERCDVWSLGAIMYILLCGAPPFYGDTDAEVLKKVRRGKYDFDMSAWEDVSMDAKELINKLLVLDARKRFTVEKALHHTWVERLAPNSGDKQISSSAFSNLKNFRAQNKLKKAALTVIAQELSEDSISELKQMFLSLDQDGDGTITIDEMKEGLAKAGLSANENLLQIMKEVDSDGSGVIDYTEFLAATMSKRQYFQEDVCWAAFRTFDLDGNGKITKDELAQVLSGGAVKTISESMGIEKEEIERIMCEVDQDGDGEIDFDEFMVMMRTNAKTGDKKEKKKDKDKDKEKEKDK